MKQITIVVMGQTRGVPSSGFGSYALLSGTQRRITRVEFGSLMFRFRG